MIAPFSILVSDAETITEPVDKAAVKRYAVIDVSDTAYDTLIDDMIPAAREQVESLSNMALVAKNVVFEMNTCRSAYLPYANGEITIGSVLDLDNEENLTNTEYKVSGHVLNVDYKGNYKVSYSLVPVVPATLKEAIKMLVTYRLRNRGDQEKQHGVPDDVMSVIKTKRVVWL